MRYNEFANTSIIEEADLRGEWWISNGVASFADGDVGDMNHEGMVMRDAGFNVISTIEDDSRFNHISIDSEYPDMDEVAKVIDEIAEANNIDEDVVLDELGIDKEEYSIALGHGDAREYGLRVYKQIRVAGKEVQMYDLNSRRMRELANGLWDAYQEEAEQATFNIEEGNGKKYFQNVPFDILESGKYSALRDFVYGYN